MIVLPDDRRVPVEEDGGNGARSNDAGSVPDEEESGSEGEADEGSDDPSDPFAGDRDEQDSDSSTSGSPESSKQSVESRSVSDVITNSDAGSSTSAEASLSSIGSTSDEGDGKDGPDTGLIIGVVAAVIVVLALIIGFCWMRRRKRGCAEKEHEHRTKDAPPELSYRGSSSIVSEQDKGGGHYGGYSHDASQPYQDQSHTEGSSSAEHRELGQPMSYAPAASQAATFAPSVADAPPPRPPPNAAQDQPAVKRGTGGWFKDRSTPSPPQGQLFPPTRDSAYEGTVKQSVAGRGAGGLTMAEQFTSAVSRSGADQGGLTMADKWAQQPPPPAASGFESQSGYTRSGYAGEAQDYYNSSAGSSYNRADNNNQSSSQNDSSGQNIKGSTRVPGHPPKAVKSEAPAGILKSSMAAQENNTGRIKYAPAPSSTRGRHAAIPSDASERTQAVGSFLEDYAAKASSSSMGSPTPKGGGSAFSDVSSQRGGGGGSRWGAEASHQINGSLAPPPSRR